MNGAVIILRHRDASRGFEAGDWEGEAQTGMAKEEGG